MVENLNKKFEAQLWSIRLSVRYHDHRVRFYDFCNNASVFISVFFSSSAAYLFLHQNGSSGSAWCSLFVALCSTLTLVYAPTRKARLHSDLKKKFIGLEKDILGAGDRVDDETLLDIAKKRLDIEAEEPPVLRVLWDFCYNEMVQLEGIEEGNILKFEPWHYITKSFCDFRKNAVKIDLDWKPHKTSLPSSPGH